MKKLSLLVSLIICSVMANAQVKFTGDAVKLAPGETKELTVSLENSVAITGFSYVMTFPEWLELAEEADDEALDESRHNDPSPNFSVTNQSSGVVVFFAASRWKKYSIASASGALFTIKVKAKDSAPIGAVGKIIGTPTEMYDNTLADVSFTCEDIDVTVGSAAVDITLANASGYNSYCCDKDLDVTGFTDAEFYVVSSVTASEATLTKVTTGIPAGEGFLIKGTGTANISVPVAATAPTATGSKLVGVTAATSIEAGNYILKSDGSSFIPCTAGTLPANKAYLKDVPASAKEFLMIVEDAVVTGINEVQAENSVNGPIYNLNGARVSNPQKGVYIMNGRKVIVK